MKHRTAKLNALGLGRAADQCGTGWRALSWERSGAVGAAPLLSSGEFARKGRLLAGLYQMLRV